MYFYKKGLAFLLGLALVFSVASVTQAVTEAPAESGVSFDLLLSNYDGSLPDITGIDFITFYGTGTIFQFPDNPPTTGTFTENGVVTFMAYNDSYSPFMPMLGGGFLKLSFTDLSGDYNEDFITFNPGQILTLNFDDGTDMTPLADFELGTNSGGFVMDEFGNSLAQNYFLTLTEDTYNILSGSPLQYEAVLTASDFQDNGTYQIMGQVNAVPVPGALILFGSGLVGLVGLKRKRAR